TGVIANGNACARWLSADPPNLEEARSAVEAAVKDAIRASDIVARVRAMAKRSPSESMPVDMNEVITDTIALIGTEVEQNGISMRAKLADALPTVSGDRIQLQQVVLNLIANAMEATRSTKGGLRDILISTERADTNGILVVVRDTGIGLEPGEGD